MRSKSAPIRKVIPDPRYNSVEVTKIINRVMISGKKSIAVRHVYNALDIIKKETKEKPLDVLLAALENIRPRVEVRSRRVGGAAYQVPMPVTPRRQSALAIRWLVDYAASRSNSEYHTYGEKLAAEVMDAYKEEGPSIKKRDDVHRMADANKAFSHFRW
jgi:small subunit ribosomal protein S7